MPNLNFHRRHRSACEGNHTPDSLTNEYDERKRGWKRCRCLIYASGTLGGVHRKKATKAPDWETARIGMAPYLTANSWSAESALPPPSADQNPVRAVPTFREACNAYLDSKATRKLAPATMKKYQTFTRQLQGFAQKKGCVRVDDVGATDMDEFYGTWKDAANSKGKKLERMQGFWNFCVKRKWLTENPAGDLEPPVGYSMPKHKSPFTDEELDRIFDAASRWKTCPWHNAGKRGEITADQIVTFIMLLAETGLRISDGATFSVPDRVNYETQECFLFMHKTGKPLYTWINPDLLARLRALTAKLGPTPFITQSRDPQQAGDAWRERLAKVFFEAGPFAEHPVPHRFRHTFVRIQLQRGVKEDDVAELIGDTPEMVRRHYARWVPERQQRLTAIMKAAYEDSLRMKWRGDVVEMPKVNRG